MKKKKQKQNEKRESAYRSIDRMESGVSDEFEISV